MINSISGFKLGGMVQYCHTCMHAVEMLLDFPLEVEKHSAKISDYMVLYIQSVCKPAVITPQNFNKAFAVKAKRALPYDDLKMMSAVM